MENLTKLEDITSVDSLGRIWITERWADENGVVHVENTYLATS